MTSWKTSLGGLLAMVAAALDMLPDHAGGAQWIKPYAPFLAALAAGIIGLAARDNNVTSEQAGLNLGQGRRPGRPNGSGQKWLYGDGAGLDQVGGGLDQVNKPPK